MCKLEEINYEIKGGERPEQSSKCMKLYSENNTAAKECSCSDNEFAEKESSGNVL